MMNLASTSDVLRIVTGTPRDAILAVGTYPNTSLLHI